jgi:hypothetical protein
LGLALLFTTSDNEIDEKKRVYFVEIKFHLNENIE